MTARRFGSFTLDNAQRRLDREGAEVPLQPKVFDTLWYLTEHPGRVVGRNELLEQLWPDTFVGDAALTRCIKEIRRALDDDPRDPRFIRTVPSVGYEFIAGVEVATSASRTGLQVLAVLPFRPLAEDQRDPSLELGMADALITKLSVLRQLVVRPLATVRHYCELDQDPLDAGQELGVDAVVEGGLLRLEDRLRVSVRVLRCEDGRALFAEQYDEPYDDVFRLQDAVCRRITAAVSLQLDAAETGRLVKHETDDLEAYRHFLRGRLGLGRLVPAEAERSIADFERALETDPGFAQAWVSVAEANVVIAWQGVDPGRYYERARRAAERALELDDRLGAAWSWLGTVAWEHDWEWQKSDRHFRRATELAPSVVDVWGRYSASCAFSGRHDEAIRLGRCAVALDESSPMAVAWLGQALHMAGRPEETIDLAVPLLDRVSEAPFARLILGLAYLQTGQLDLAIASLEQAAATLRPDVLSMLAHAYIRAGQQREAEALEDRLAQAGPEGVVPPFARAMLHAAREDADRFFEAMAEVFDQPSLHAALLASDPLFERYRSDPRAEPLIRRLRLPETT